MATQSVPPSGKAKMLLSIQFHLSDFPAMLILRTDWVHTGEYEIICRRSDLEGFNDALQAAQNFLADEVWEMQQELRVRQENKNDSPVTGREGESSL